ncbi:MAG: hypothetical protein I8H98_04460 [Moraxellaceae bacterium]|uniref:Uncharacterized protein n=1 Tax=Acinetobacter tjernbergiae DSM 14971 = CIP 107465 TaxID=1120928 RepID=V2W7M0_9GAMM|nr:hypothetical protein [Acinetobacter tjernbergiae]ESK56004.1 hypothetical protein F990_01436 [Acinetobacter tjernbergiae DSM 14971 = CIP 107465]MBH2001507.1 hypothetical protein [Moraxellaceae bacterium]
MLSIISKHKALQSKLGLKIDQFYNILVGIIIFSIFLLAHKALQRPVNELQYQQMIQFSQQASHPKTQQMAEGILEHTQIRRVDYLKLLNAYQFESSRIKEYPAMAQEDE